MEKLNFHIVRCLGWRNIVSGYLQLIIVYSLEKFGNFLIIEHKYDKCNDEFKSCFLHKIYLCSCINGESEWERYQ